MYVQAKTRDGAVHVVVAEKVYIIGIKSYNFFENLFFAEKVRAMRKIKNVGLGVQTDNSFRPFYVYFNWVVCAHDTVQLYKANLERQTVCDVIEI